MIKNKKAMSHVEVILSFIIFTGFVIFLLAILNPFKSLSGGQVYLDAAERGIKDAASVNVDFLTIKVNTDISGNCFSFEYHSALNKIIVKDENYNPVDAYSTGTGDVRNIVINGKEGFFYIYSCEKFNEKSFSGSCQGLSEGGTGYTLGLARDYKMLSLDKLTELKTKYENDYENAKKDIGLPASKEFLFSVRDTSKSTLGKEAADYILKVEKTVPKTKVLARDIRTWMVDEDGTIEYVILNVQVW